MDEIECTKCIYNINNECKIGGWTIPKVGCPDGKAKLITNADRIRAMTDEEMAEFISGKARGFGEEYEGYMSALDWLKEEATDD